MKNKNELSTQMQRVIENIREPINAMTIRDQFAMAAMQSVAGNKTCRHDIARTSYAIADAMLAERNK